MPVPAGPRDPSRALDGVAYRRWLTAGRDGRCGRRQAALRNVAQVDERVLRDEIGGGLHVGVRQLQAVSHQRRELADDAVHLVEVGRFAFDEQIVPLGADPDVEEGLEVLEVLVVGAEQGLDPLFGDGDALHQFNSGFSNGAHATVSDRPVKAPQP